MSSRLRTPALLWLSLLLLTTATATPPGARVLWRIGRTDRNDAEFALAPSQWRKWSGDPVYLVGASTPRADWPYVQPGPADVWAGRKPHTFTIVFGLTAVPAPGECRFRCHLLDTQSNVPPRLRIQVNGQPYAETLPAGSSDATLNGDPSRGHPREFTVAFPARLLHRGDNNIQITTTAGSWMIYDALALETPAGARLGRARARTLIVRIRPIRALESRHGRLVQPVEVTLRRFGRAAAATIQLVPAASAPPTGPAQPVHLTLQRGLNTAEALVPAVAAPTSFRVLVTVAGRPLGAEHATMLPVRRLTLYLLPHSHTDIGYTELQSAVKQRQRQNLLDGMAAARRTADYPAGARFVWNVEVLWAVDQYLHHMNAAQRAEFVAAVKDGQVALNGMYVNELTGLCRPEELLRLFRYATRLEQQCGVKIDSAMISDVPGYTWGTVTALSQAGIRYFSVAPNWFDRIGDILVQWQNKPFYWVSPSGREKVLVWIPFKGYALSHIYHDLSAKLLDDLQADLDRVNYPYDIAYTRWAGHGDNAVPDPAICDFIKDWNAKYVWPKLAISSTSRVFHALETKYGPKLPVVRGDWTPYWEDGAGSSARETALNRNASDRLSQAEVLWAMLDRPAYPARAFDHAWRNVILYSEHTWGAAGSAWDPLSPMTKAQWAVKRGYAVDADTESRALVNEAIAAPSDQALAAAVAFDVYNANSWPRTGLVTLDAAESAGRDRVLDAQGRPVPSQRLATGKLAFLVRDVPPFGAARYTLVHGPAHHDGPAAVVRGTTLENGLLRMRLDPKSGAIVGLRARDIDANLAGPGGLNTYLYLRGDKLANLRSSGPATITVKEPGPLVASVLVTSSAPGCRHLTREVRLVAGLDHVELINTVDKERAPIAPYPGDHAFAQSGGKESVNFGFPFAIPHGDLRIDLPIGSMRPDRDQIPGGCKNWFTVGRWIDAANADYGVTCATLDTPLIEVGGITARLLGSQHNPAVWRHRVDPTATFYSWVMNNHWGTNYRAYQTGPTVFRYVLRPHGPIDPAADTRFATGFTQPLIVRPANPARPPAPPRLRLSTNQVVVETFKPSDDGRGWIIRLYGASGNDHHVRLTWSNPAPRSLWLSNTSERRVRRIRGAVDVPGWDIVTLRAER